MGHIRQRGPGTYQLIYYVGRDANGKDKYKSETVKGERKDAEDRLLEIEHKLNTGEFVPPGKETVEQFMATWLEEIKPTIRPKTHTWYKGMVDNHITPAMGKAKLSKITPLQIQAVYRNLLDELSPSTVKGVHRTLRAAFGQAVKWGLIAKNPVDQVDPPKVEKKEYRTLTAEEIDKLLLASVPTGRYSLYLAAVTTGMRQGELLGLRWRDIDIDKGIIIVRQQLARSWGEPEFGPVKTDSGRRVVAMPESLITALKDHRQMQQRERELYGAEYKDYDLVWAVLGGGPISSRNLNRQFKTLLKKANLPDIRFHDLRHTHATLLLEAGIHPKVVQERLGHSAISVTMDIYSHVKPNIQKEAAAAIDKALTRGRGEKATEGKTGNKN